MIKAGIIGGAGYTAGELLRLLVRHPDAHLAFVHSNSQAGRPVTAVHRDLIGESTLTFTNEVTTEVDVLFLCSGHGKSSAFLREHSLPERIKIIDLSSDFRLADQAEGFVYGLPELRRATIAQSDKVANPGCFATAIQLALLPLAERHLLHDDVHVHALTGSTGAGHQPTATTHFSRRDNNVSIYKPFTHQHLGEIRQSIRHYQPAYARAVRFLPLRGNFSRGIFASLYTTCSLDAAEARRLFQDYYATHPFVHLVDENPDLKQVVNTNKCLLFLQKHEDQLLIVSLIDNLLKGASGQAVQNLNLMFGLPETRGLQLKASVY